MAYDRRRTRRYLLYYEIETLYIVFGMFVAVGLPFRRRGLAAPAERTRRLRSAFREAPIGCSRGRSGHVRLPYHKPLCT